MRLGRTWCSALVESDGIFGEKLGGVFLAFVTRDALLGARNRNWAGIEATGR